MSCDCKLRAENVVPSLPRWTSALSSALHRPLRDALRSLPAGGPHPRQPSTQPSYGLMLMLFAERRFADAEQIFRQLCGLDQANADVFRVGAVNAWHYGLRYAAQMRIRRALTLDPTVVESLICAAEIFSLCGSLDEAIASARRAVALAPEYGAAYNCLGLAHWRNHHRTEARRAFEIACNLDHHDHDARHNLRQSQSDHFRDKGIAGIYIGQSSPA